MDPCMVTSFMYVLVNAVPTMLPIQVRHYAHIKTWHITNHRRVCNYYTAWQWDRVLWAVRVY